MGGSLSDGPSDYSPSLECSWLINAGGPVTLSFSSFATEASYDFVRVYDGSSTLSPRLAEYSGPSAQSVTSSGAMLVVFSSDSSVQAAGFLAGYSTSSGGSIVSAVSPVSTVTAVPPVAPVAAISQSGCTSLTQSSGSITDGPSNYADNAD